jgi:tetratricopeptide (TPR) repeat protein
LPPDPFATKYHNDLYAGEIAYSDHCIGQVIAKLKNSGLYESTLIIITADHGEMLGEHGELTHAYFIYQSAIKIPLIFKIPGHLEAKNIEAPVGIIDIVPTVCAMLGIDAPDQVQGKDLSGYFIEKEPSVRDRFLYCESLTPTKNNANPLLGLVTDRWKYIQTTRPELYDILEDPKETTNLIKHNPAQAFFLQDRLRHILKESVPDVDTDSKVKLDAQDRKRLESLGYIASTRVTEDFQFDQNKDDPKDLIDIFNRHLKATSLFNPEKYKEAKIVCEKILLERPQYLEAYLLLGKIAKALDDLAAAVSYLTKAITLKPDDTDHLFVNPYFASVHNDLGLALARLEHLNQAISHYYEALSINPAYEQAHNNLGNALASQGKFNDAIDHYYEALRLNPNYVKAHNNLANVLLSQAKPDEAIHHYSEALRIDPEHAEIHRNLGAALVREGKIKSAISHFQEALRIRPDFLDAFNKLKTVLEAQAKIDDTIAKSQQALSINPGDPTLHYKLGNLYKRNGELDQAIDQYQKALSLQPGLINVLDTLAMVYSLKMEYDKAISLFSKIIDLRPDSAATYYNIACMHARQKRIQKSVAWLKKAINKGYKNWDLIKTDKDLENIRGTSYYTQLMKSHYPGVRSRS